MPLPAPPKERKVFWTGDEFLEWLQPGIHADLIQGEKLMHSPVNFRHADLLNFLDGLLRGYVEIKDLGRLYREVVAVKLSTRNVFLPDLMYFPEAMLPQLQPTYAPVAPPFVVEVLSRWTADRDLGPKFSEYEEHGVQEYWVLDPDDLDHKFFKRQGELLVEFAQSDSKIESMTIPGFWVMREWLDSARLPKHTECLAQVLGQK